MTTCIEPDRFNTATLTTSTSRSTALTGTVIVKDGGTVVGSFVPTNNRVRHIKELICADDGVLDFQTIYTGDELNKGGAKQSITLRTGDKTLGNIGDVKTIVAGPGIYITPRDGQGTVVISLEPIREIQPTDDYDYITYTISDVSNPNEHNLSAFYVVGGSGGINAGDGICLRSRDGVNFVELNNTRLPTTGLLNVTALQSDLIPGSGVTYFSASNFVNAQGTGTDLTTKWGLDGRTDTVSCGWCTDDLVDNGPRYRVGGNPITNRKQKFIGAYYNTGSILSNTLFLSYGVTDTDNPTSSIYRFTGFPIDWTVYDSGTNPTTVTVVEEQSFDRESFQNAATDLEEYSFADYTIVAASSDSVNDTGSLWKSDRSGLNASTWTNVLTTSGIVFSVAYGNGIWVAVGDQDRIFTSTNATSWTENTTKRPGTIWYDIAYGEGYFIACGTRGRISYSKDNGSTWTASQSGTTSTLKSIAYGPDLCRFVAVGNNRSIVSVKV
jgi:hypothetical protein